MENDLPPSVSLDGDGLNLFRRVPDSPIYEVAADLVRPRLDDLTVVSQAKQTGDGHTVLTRFSGRELPRELVQWFEGLSLDLHFVQVFASVPNNVGVIHKDGTDRKATLNIPLEGCDDSSWVEWFDSRGLTEKLIVTPITSVRISVEEMNIMPGRLILEPTASLVLNGPHVLNTNVWHRLNNRNNRNYRYVAALRFKNNPSVTELASALIVNDLNPLG